MITRPPSELVTQFLEKTAFPDLTVVSAKIVDHAKEAVLLAASELNLKVRFLAYDNTCSVAKGRALPGSDLDELIAVVELTGVKRVPTLWDRMRFRDVEGEFCAVERDAAQKLRDEFKNRLDFELIGRDQTLKVVSLSEMENLFLTFSKDDDSIPMVIGDVEETAQHQRAGAILVDDLYKISEKWGHTDAYQRDMAAAGALDSFPLPTKFKVQSRADLIAQFGQLPEDEQLLIIEIMRSDLTDARRPVILNSDELNPYLETAKKLEQKGLLFLFNPADAQIKSAIEATNARVGWIERAYLRTLELQRYVAPWKLFHADEMILSEFFDSPKMQALHQRLITLQNGDGLPRALKAWWSGIHQPGYNEKTDKIAQSLAKGAFRKN